MLHNGEIYGILGVEISLKYLERYFNVKDLDNSLNAGYALMEDQGDGQYKVILGKGRYMMWLPGQERH